MKRSIKMWLLMVAVSFFGISSMAYAYVYTDTFPAQKYYQAIEFLSDEGIINGYPDGSYKPLGEINRAELLKVLIEAEYDEEDFGEYGDDKCFNDVPANEWYTKYVCFAKDRGFVEGYVGNTFRPEQGIIFVEAMKIVMQVLDIEYSDDVGPWYDADADNPWYGGLVVKASDRNLIPLDFYYFAQPVNRGQVADMITRSLKSGSADLKEYLGFTYDYRVTYETLSDGHLVEEDVMRSHITEDDEAVKVYQNFRYPDTQFLFTVVMYSYDSEVDEVLSCMQGYYNGTWNIDIVNGNGEKIGEDELGELAIPPDKAGSIIAFEVELDNGDWKQFMLVENYGSCNGNKFNVYEFDPYVKGVKPARLSGTSEHYIVADSRDSIEFEGKAMRYTYYDNSIAEYVGVTYLWDEEEEMFMLADF